MHYRPAFHSPPYRFLGVMLCICSLPLVSLQGDENRTANQQGVVRFEPLPQAKCPQRFQLEPHEFDFQLTWRNVDSPRFETADVTFPSPVKTPHEANNTVHAEYYRPKVEGKRPAVIVLHILGGDFALARLFCHSLNQKGTAALFVKMPYYGPRRDPRVRRRMIADDPRETVEGMTQAVLDIRRAAAFLAQREEVDPDQIGILGVSLGGITACLAATAEPRIQNVCLLLAGGDFPRIAAESKEFARQRERFLAAGRDGEEFARIIRDVDPLQYAQALQGRRVLMLNAEDDEVIPRACTESLWSAAGQPPIVWYSGGHYSVIRHLPPVLHKVNRFFEK